jgi:thioredoxin-dependent peroxiredoxin
MSILSIGSLAPNFVCADQNNEPISLKNFRGTKVILFFYPHDLTATCTVQACNLRDHYAELRQKGFELIGVSTDEALKHQKFIQKNKLPYRLLCDTDRKVHELYGVWQEKKTFGKVYMGTVRTTFVIDEKGIIIRIIDKVKAKNHAQQILEETVVQYQ